MELLLPLHRGCRCVARPSLTIPRLQQAVDAALHYMLPARTSVSGSHRPAALAWCIPATRCVAVLRYLPQVLATANAAVLEACTQKLADCYPLIGPEQVAVLLTAIGTQSDAAASTSHAWPRYLAQVLAQAESARCVLLRACCCPSAGRLCCPRHDPAMVHEFLRACLSAAAPRHAAPALSNGHTKLRFAVGDLDRVRTAVTAGFAQDDSRHATARSAWAACDCGAVLCRPAHIRPCHRVATLLWLRICGRSGGAAAWPSRGRGCGG